MPFLTPTEEENILSELKSLAQLIGGDVVESSRFPTVMVRVSVGGNSSTITKQGSDFLATDPLPDVPMTEVGYGTGMFGYRLEI
ncbi:MAG TPA: hypothetical protein VEZ90_09045 [Blastocatellia bacterium]|nr:hypothetical protein [Blastocatellia bacterium]